MRQASTDLAAGRIGAALAAYDDAGMVRSEWSRDEAIASLIEDWNDDYDPARTALILAHRRADVHQPRAALHCSADAGSIEHVTDRHLARSERAQRAEVFSLAHEHAHVRASLRERSQHRAAGASVGTGQQDEVVRCSRGHATSLAPARPDADAVPRLATQWREEPLTAPGG